MTYTAFTLARFGSVWYGTVRKCIIFTLRDLARKVARLQKRILRYLLLLELVCLAGIAKDGFVVSFSCLLLFY